MKTLAELQAIRDKARMQVGLRSEGGAELRVQVGMATCGIAAGARPVLNAFVEEAAKRGLQNVMITQTGCIGICQFEPVVEVVNTKDGSKVTYVKMTAEKAVRVVNDHLVNGNVVTEFTIGANS
ncbi:MAG: (2Fe-2S) ferredoxin domain-containing protein [Hydrogeniiclostridium sp.]|jgi:NADP-reducing hydrogenase subunit HndB